MKKIFACCLMVMMLMLGGCRGDVYDVYVDSVTYTVDTNEQTITVGSEVYTYRITGDRSGYEIVITYPNGARYTATNITKMIWTDQNEGLSSERRQEGKELAEYLEYEVPRAKKTFGEMFLPGLMSLVMLGVGFFHALKPELVWKIDHYFHVKGGEPTEWAIFSCKLSGWLLVVLAVIVFFVQFYS